MSLTIAGTSGTATYSDPSVGYIFSSGAYWESFNVGLVEYQYQEIEVPGRDGTDSKNHGARRRTLAASVIYVGASAAAVNGAYVSDLASLGGVPCTATMPDSSGTYAATYVESMTPAHPPRYSGSGISGASGYSGISGAGASLTTASVQIIIDGQGDTITTGTYGALTVEYAATITGVRLLADQTGSVVVDVWVDSYANYPPTDADSITAANEPEISGGTKYVDTTLTGWDTSLSAGDTIYINVDSVTTIERLTVILILARA